MSKRQGPHLMIEASCQGCEYERSSYYAIQGDSGHIVRCEHPDGQKRIGDSTWQTPVWCPMLPEAKRRLAMALNNEDVNV